MHIGCFCIFDKFRTIDNRVAVIDAVSTEKFHGSFNVAPMFSELAGVDRDFETGIFCHLEGFPKVFRFMIGLPIINTDGVLIRVPDHFFNEFDCRFRCIFSVDRRDGADDNTITLKTLSDAFIDRLTSFVVTHEML